MGDKGLKLVLICAGDFAALCCRVSPCGARYFPSDGKAPKGSPGDAYLLDFAAFPARKI